MVGGAITCHFPPGQCSRSSQTNVCCGHSMLAERKQPATINATYTCKIKSSISVDNFVHRSGLDGTHNGVLQGDQRFGGLDFFDGLDLIDQYLL